MAIPIVEELRRARVAPLSVEQFEAMIARGILPEGAPIELIDGLLVFKDRAAVGEDSMTVGPRHYLTIARIAKTLRAALEKRGCDLRIQAPIRIPPKSEPEPDLAVARGAPEKFRDRHPEPGEILCVIEVADSSLAYDRSTKARIYAEAPIRQYVLVNIPEAQVEIFDRPRKGRYSRQEIRRGSEKLTVAGVAVKTRDLLP